MQEMKKCQYCGSNDLGFGEICCPAVITSKEKYVRCKQCGASGPSAINDELAIQKWNNRIQEAPEMPQERPMIATWMDAENAYCPLNKGVCRNCLCMMWLRIGDNKGRCGLVNTQYINSTVCGA